MEAFGAVLWAVACLLLVVLLAPAALLLRGSRWSWERVYLLVSWVTFPLVIPVFLLALLPTDPNLPGVFVLLALLRGMFGLLLVPVGLVLLLWGFHRRVERRYVLWIALTIVANSAPVLVLLVKR